MKKKFIKIVLFLTLGLSTAVFYSCEGDDVGIGIEGNPFKITATNVKNSSPHITTVAAFIHWRDANNVSQYDVIAQAPYKNNGFTLELPAIVPAKYLSPIAQEMEEGFVISDKQAKYGEVELIEGYDKDEKRLDHLWIGADGDTDNNNYRIASSYV